MRLGQRGVHQPSVRRLRSPSPDGLTSLS
jgi:hypothetical protein